MIVLGGGPDRPPLQISGRLLAAPGIWEPDGRLDPNPLGALVTPPLGWQWDEEPAVWRAVPGGLLWAPPRRPLERTMRRLARRRAGQPRLVTLAPADPRPLSEAILRLEEEEAAGYLLWDAAPEGVAAARRVTARPLIAELPCTGSERAGALVAAGADLLWLGPPRAGPGPARLWGPAIAPLVESAVVRLAGREQSPLIAGAGIGSAADAAALRAAGAALVALGPPWWVRPALAAEIAAALETGS